LELVANILGFHDRNVLSASAQAAIEGRRNGIR
jgi:hypothetical protein